MVSWDTTAIFTCDHTKARFRLLTFDWLRSVRSDTLVELVLPGLLSCRDISF